MNNDITSLAQLVSKAKASVFTMEYISHFEASDIDSDDVDLRFEVEGVETGTNVSIVDECGQAAQVITTLVEALEAGDTENERMARDLISRNGEIEGLRKRVEELEEITTDYGMKFQRAQDDLKKMALMHRDESRTVTVKLPAACADDEYFNDGVFQPMRYERDVERALRAAGINVEAE